MLRAFSVSRPRRRSGRCGGNPLPAQAVRASAPGLPCTATVSPFPMPCAVSGRQASVIMRRKLPDRPVSPLRKSLFFGTAIPGKPAPARKGRVTDCCRNGTHIRGQTVSSLSQKACPASRKRRRNSVRRKKSGFFFSSLPPAAPPLGPAPAWYGFWSVFLRSFCPAEGSFPPVNSTVLAWYGRPSPSREAGARPARTRRRNRRRHPHQVTASQREAGRRG